MVSILALARLEIAHWYDHDHDAACDSPGKKMRAPSAGPIDAAQSVLVPACVNA